MSRNEFADPVPTRNLAGDRASLPPAQGLKLTVTAGPDAGASAVVASPTAIVGRAVGADFRLADPAVSSFHVELTSTERGVAVRDLKSRNGTGHAGALLERALVPSGATLEIGSTLLRVELDAPIPTPLDFMPSFGELCGGSDVMLRLFSTLARLARADLSILIEGPTGTGKELAARALHQASPYARQPFVVLDCTAIPGALAESLLFGHEKGAFTGANDRRAGIFEAAEGGTVFLDEVGELPLELQPKLLRVLERREVVRVGGAQPRAIQVRVVSATWRDLRTMVNEGRFREDLYYRLAQARVLMPALRERPADVPVLAQRFLQALPPGVQGARAISPEALAELARRDYAGNVRELKSTVERAAVMAEGAVITPADLAFERMLMGERDRAPNVAVAAPASGLGATPSVAPPPPPAALAPFKEAKRTIIDEFERDYLQRLLGRTGNNLTRAASIAGIERGYLRDLFRKHGLRSDE